MMVGLVRCAGQSSTYILSKSGIHQIQIQTGVSLNPVITQMIQSTQEELLLFETNIEYLLKQSRNHQIEPGVVYEHVQSN